MINTFHVIKLLYEIKLYLFFKYLLQNINRRKVMNSVSTVRIIILIY